MGNSKNYTETKEAFADFCKLVEQLRDPEDGCPWDLEQDHQTLAKYLIEEAYEASAAMLEDDKEEICDELGDVLLQVVLNAQIASESKTFDISKVVRSIHEKMYRRHPHVFGSPEEKTAREVPQILKKWEEIKATEKKVAKNKSSLLGDKNFHKIAPASTQAAKIGKAAGKVRFDWSSPDEVFDVLLSEIQELKEEWKHSEKKPNKNIESEIGDIYFTLAQLCRHLGLDAESTALKGNLKFLKRFGHMETQIKNRELKVSDFKSKDWEKLWKEAKEQA